MAPELARRLADDLSAYPLDHVVELCWHAGEPLTAGVEHMARLMEPFEALRRAGRVRHSLQTNATLVTPAWCTLFHRFGVAVGVSVDGPRWASRHRRTLSGAESFERAMAGTARLRAEGVEFTTIAVVTSATIPAIVDRAGRYLEFFRALGASEVGFNIEEQEGSHKVGSIPAESVSAFWQALFDAWLAAGAVPRVRDFERVLAVAQDQLDGTVTREWIVDPMPTVTHDGDVVLLSPELAGQRDSRYDDFVVGNLYAEGDSLQSILERGTEARYVREFLAGTEKCQDTCVRAAYCQGGQASNRYFEHGDFSTHTTTFCTRARHLLADVVLGAPHDPGRNYRREVGASSE